MASSWSFGGSKFDLATQGRRQPGSTFKMHRPDHRAAPGRRHQPDLVRLRELNFTDKATGGRSTCRTPTAAPRAAAGPCSRQRSRPTTPSSSSSTSTSARRPSAKTANDMGITSKLDAYPAEVLGGLRKGGTPLEMAREYATIDAGGDKLKPIAITKVEFADGKVDLARQAAPDRRSSGRPDARGIKAMQANAERGTGTARQPRLLPDSGQDGDDDGLRRRVVRRQDHATSPRSCGSATRAVACR